MGNQQSGQRIEPGASDLPNDLVYKAPLGGGRLFKTSLCLHDDGGLVVVKSATLPQDAGALNRYNHALTHVGNALATVHNPHVWPTSPKRGIYRTDRSIHLVRQYFSASIASRISTRPFLTDAEKKWLGWQLLKAVAQMHDVGICHGDIKAENVLLTSWGWLMLADFAPYKPVMLPSDNPVDFSFFFDTSRRKCCLAPERFYDPQPGKNFYEDTSQLTTAMDIFAVGCILYEIFNDGQPLFDYSKLLAYRRGDHDASESLKAMKETELASLIAHMVQLDPSRRLTAPQYLQQFPVVMNIDSSITDVFHEHLSMVLMMDGDRRASYVADRWPELLRNFVDVPTLQEATEGETRGQRQPQQRASIAGHTDTTMIQQEDSGTAEEGEHRLDHEIAGYEGMPEPERLQAEASHLLEIAQKMASSVSMASVPKKSELFQNKVSSVSSRYDEGIESLQAATGTEVSDRKKSLFGSDNKASFEEGSGRSLSLPARSSTMTTTMAVDRSQHLEASSKPNDGIILLLTVVCTVYRGSRRQKVRVRLLNQLASCSKLCGEDFVRLQFAIPLLIVAAVEPCFTAARCTALRALQLVLSHVRGLPPGESRSFTDYVLPSLSLLPMDNEASIQSAYAGILGPFVTEAQRGIESSQRMQGGKKSYFSTDSEGTDRRPSPHGTVQYDEEMCKFRNGLERTLHDLLVGPSLGPKLSLLPHLGAVSRILDRRDTADGLLPALLTLFNSREWQARSALYSSLEGVLHTLGRPGVSFLAPFFDRMLSDIDAQAATAAIRLLHTLSSNALLQRRHLLSAARKAFELRESAPCAAVRASASRLYQAITSALPPVTVLALLPPGCLEGVVTEPERASSFGKKRHFPPTSTVPATSDGQEEGQNIQEGLMKIQTQIPSVWYSVAIDSNDVRRANSHLKAALAQAEDSGTSLLGLAQRHALKSPALPKAILRDSKDQEHPAHVRSELSVTRAMSGETVSHRHRAASPLRSSDVTEVDNELLGRLWRPKGVLVAHLPAHKAEITRLAGHPKSSVFVSVGEDGVANVWDTGRLERDISFEPRAQYTGHCGVSIRAASVIQSSSVSLTGDAKGNLHVWNVERIGAGRTARWHLHHAHQTKLCGGPIMDLLSWDNDVVAAATRSGGIVGLDLRAPVWSPSVPLRDDDGGRNKYDAMQGICWRLPVPSPDGVITRMVGDEGHGFWLVSGTTRGVMCLWDTRMLLPVQRWIHPMKARIEALALEASTIESFESQNDSEIALEDRESAQRDPIVYAAAGAGEVGAWNIVTGRCTGVVRVRTSGTRKKPDALSAPMPELGGGNDPVGRAAYLGAPELRALSARPKGMRALLPIGRGALITAGSDCTVRLWDCNYGREDKSYVVVASPEYGKGYGPSTFRTDRIDQVPVVEDVGYEDRQQHPAGIDRVLRKEGSSGSRSSKSKYVSDGELERRRESTQQWDRTAALAHQAPVIDALQVDGRAEPLLVTASLDGIVKVWR